MSGLRTFFVAFSVSFAIFFSVGLFFWTENAVKTSGQASNFSAPRVDFVIPKQQDINIFLAVCQQKPKPADIYVLIKISACNDSVSLASIPKTLRTVVNTKTGQIQELYDWGGVNCARQAVENLTDIEVDRTIQAQDDEIIEIVDSVGGVRFDDGKIVYGEDYCKILRQDPVEAIAALKNCFDSEADLSRFFSSVSGFCSTTFSQYDFDTRKTGFEQMAKKKASKLFLPKLEVETAQSHDRLTQSSRAELWEAFGKDEIYN